MKKIVSGGIAIFVGMFMLLGFAVNFSEEGFVFTSGDAAALVLFVLAPLGLGTFLIRGHFVDKQKSLEARQKALQKKREKQVIRLAQQHGGRLTVPEIAVGTSMGTSEAEAFMEEMTANGYVDMQVTESGVIVYEFYEIAHRNRLEE